MRLRVELSNFGWNNDYRCYITEASTIGLAPGYWVDEIEVWDRNTGREAIFYKGKAMKFQGELQGYSYGNASTITLKVYND